VSHSGTSATTIKEKTAVENEETGFTTKSEVETKEEEEKRSQAKVIK